MLQNIELKISSSLKILNTENIKSYIITWFNWSDGAMLSIPIYAWPLNPLATP